MDVSCYASPEFNCYQMEQIRLGLEDEIDVSPYLNPSFNYEEMQKIRLTLERK